MKIRSLFLCAALVASSASMIACDDTDDTNTPCVGDDCDGNGGGNGDGNGDDDCPDVGTTVDVFGLITEDTTWCEGVTYDLQELVYIEDATLTIEPGTKIVGGEGAALVSTTTGRLISEGTADKPIVFTSRLSTADAQPGDWGGVVMLGRAQINVDGGKNNIEGIDPGEDRGEYGGSDDSHDCGTIAYTRIEYAGYLFGDNNELNGLTLGGCGSGTTLHHIQVIDGLDDGIEFFGGTADLSYAVVTNPGDDGVDWDEGFRGRMQFIVVEMETPNSSDPRAFEWDGLSANHDATPLAHVVMSNATIYQTGNQANVQGAMIRRGGGADLFNILVAGFSSDYIAIGDPASGGRISIEGLGFFGISADATDYPTANNEHYDVTSDVTVAGTSISVPYPDASSAAATEGVAGPTDSWFQAAEYLGAFDPSKPAAEQWDAGWTR